MDVLILVSVLVGLAVYVAHPLYVPRMRIPSDEGDRAEMEARRQALYQQLRDLDADHRTGLLPPEEHERQRHTVELEAAAVLRALTQDRPRSD